MKEKLYTLPLKEAFAADDECPLCYIERKLEQDALNFTLGSSSSYMESDIRAQTDEMGFCQAHFKQMYLYGNTLGNALILKTHYQKLISDFEKSIKKYNPSQPSLFKKAVPSDSSLVSFVKQQEDHCFICDYIRDTYLRYLDTFFHLLTTDPTFLDLIRSSKGFCLHHFGELAKEAETRLSLKEKQLYIPVITEVTLLGTKRLCEDVSWLVEKFDYRNQNADWKNSRDALPRGMQKIAGGYPSDPPYKSAK